MPSPWRYAEIKIASGFHGYGEAASVGKIRNQFSEPGFAIEQEIDANSAGRPLHSISPRQVQSLDTGGVAASNGPRRMVEVEHPVRRTARGETAQHTRLHVH